MKPTYSQKKKKNKMKPTLTYESPPYLYLLLFFFFGINFGTKTYLLWTLKKKRLICCYLILTSDTILNVFYLIFDTHPTLIIPIYIS